MDSIEPNQANPTAGCACGHPIPDHGPDGCLYPDPAGGLEFCPCTVRGRAQSRDGMYLDMADKLRDVVHDVVLER